MPYMFAHPAAAIPLRFVLGPLAVPSALAIGSVAPDLWYLVYFVDREQSHSAAGLLWFCLPAGLLLYAAFHLLFKHPVLSLMPAWLAARLAHWTCPSLPRVPWYAPVVSLLAGSLAHLAWDALTHGSVRGLEEAVFAVGRYNVHMQQLLQHSSTLLGSAFLAWWLWRKLRAPAHLRPSTVVLPIPLRAGILSALFIASAAPLWHAALGTSAPALADIGTVRTLLRGAATSGLSALGLGLVAYCMLWRIGGMGHHPHAEDTSRAFGDGPLPAEKRGIAGVTARPVDQAIDRRDHRTERV